MPDNGEIASLRDTDWDLLVARIKGGQCTPFLGAGIAYGVLPTGRQLAEKWAADPLFKYPLPDTHDLIKVAQYIALTADFYRPKEMIVEIINKAGYPNFDDPEEPHAILAKLPLPLYITTNYDDFMLEALRKAGNKEPQLFVNQWFNDGAPSKDQIDINPNVDKPAVYYFHGFKDDLDTIVLTEDDYLEFLVKISKDQTLIPPRIQQALASTSLLFIGYSLGDMNLRVIFRGLVESAKKNMRRISMAVQVPDNNPQVVRYLTEYFGASGIRVYWGTARQFLSELRRRMDGGK